jgi:hypothetical protein
MQEYFITLRKGALVIFIAYVLFINFYSHFKGKEDKQSSGFNGFLDNVNIFLSVYEYRFFSPDIADSFVFLQFTKKEEKLLTVPVTFNCNEMRTRIHTLCFTFYEKDFARDLIARSIATYTIPRHSIHNLRLNFFVYKLPTMREHRKGYSPKLYEFYSSEYEISNDK